MKKNFSLQEANDLIPTLKKDFLKLIKLNKALSLLRTIHITYEDRDENTIQEIKLNKKYHKESYEFYSLLEKIESQGCYVRDLENGRLNFSSTFNGRGIYLCWQVTDDKIKHWHETSTNFKGKKPVSMINKRFESKKNEW